MNPNKALWEKGDFTQIAATMRESGDAFVETLGIRPGQFVLDLGSGDGATAIPAAQRGADVLGVDIAANLVAAGNARARALGLAKCRFQEGDASALTGLEDRAFDLTVTVFGAMFAPKPNDVAHEMARVTRRGGRIVMGNWIPGDPTLVAQILKISAAYTPPPPEGSISPMLWGVEEHVTARFKETGIAADRIAFARETFAFRCDGPPQRLLERFRRYYGPTMNAFDAAEKSGRADALAAELEDLFVAQNRSGEPDKTLIPATFLRVEATLA
ncbi:MAG: methyltransferase domain-containing protein [Alphaproteobacteria bacterium]|nr:methyltransferase domain-containing protein [Alphaproteobacteria bacterium]